MLASLMRTALPLVLVAQCVANPARADIYTWVDKSGAVNMSNLPPPEGAQVVKVVPELPRAAPPPVPPGAVNASADEVQNLADRVRQLEHELDFARQSAPPAYAFVPIPVPQPVLVEAPPMQYVVPATGPDAWWCDPLRFGCATWSGLYPPTVVVVGTTGYRRPHPHRGAHPAPHGVRGPGWLAAGTRLSYAGRPTFGSAGTPLYGGVRTR